MKVKIFRFMVKGIGIIRPMNTTISKTRRRKTWKNRIVSTCCQPAVDRIQ